MENRQGRDEILHAMKRRAVGYETRESVDEFTLIDGELTLVKRRITTKEMAPDVSAAKLVIDTEPDETEIMSAEEIAAEKKRLLMSLLAGEKPPPGRGGSGAGAREKGTK